MTFLHVAALAVALLVAGPLLAHLLHRRRSDIRDFPPARLVPPSPPLARSRRQVDDRLLYAVRTLSVLALALLGAVPFIRCSGLALGRRAGASVALAIVLDDSLSMRATTNGTTSRWDRAQSAARDLVRGAREGDAIAIVLAGSPARIALATTTDLSSARTALDGLGPSDRGTDLSGAIELARALVEGLPQTDRRVVLLSDLADGQPDQPELAGTDRVQLWVPLEEIVGPAEDCAVLRADRQRSRVVARLVCSDPKASVGRSFEVREGDRVVATASLPEMSTAKGSVELAVDLREPTSGDLSAVLTGSDAVGEDDWAPVLDTTGKMSLGIVSDPASSRLATGGPPAVEQAIAALEVDAQTRPLPVVPDHLEGLAGYAGLLIEDPSGFTPETRRALATWLSRGGVALLALGPRLTFVPLGATFEPLLLGPVTWEPPLAAGLDRTSSAVFGAGVDSLADLHPLGRATLDSASLTAAAAVPARWVDGAPFLVERPIGRGLVLALTLPTSPEVSDFPLRPAFLSLVDRFVSAARARTGSHRTEVGQPWSFDAVRTLEATGPAGNPVPSVQDGGRRIIVPGLLGRYRVAADGDNLIRVAEPAEREVDFRPRRVASSSRSVALGEVRARVDLSPFLAVALLALLLSELGIRLWIQQVGPRVPAVSPETQA